MEVGESVGGKAAIVGISGVAAGALTYLLGGRQVFAALSTGVATSLAVKLLETNRQLKQAVALNRERRATSAADSTVATLRQELRLKEAEVDELIQAHSSARLGDEKRKLPTPTAAEEEGERGEVEEALSSAKEGAGSLDEAEESETRLENSETREAPDKGIVSGKRGSVSTSGAAQKDWRFRFDTLQASRGTMPPEEYTKRLHLLTSEQKRLRDASMERSKKLSAESRKHLAKSKRIGRQIDRDLAVLRKNIGELTSDIDGTGEESED